MRTMADRVAAAILAIGGITLVAAGTLIVADALPDLLRARGEHMAGETLGWVLVIGVPILAGGLLVLLSALPVWKGDHADRAIVLAWIATAGFVCAFVSGAPGNVLYAVRVILLESGTWSVSGSAISVGSDAGANSIIWLDEVTSWIPVMVAVPAILLAGCLIAGWIAGRARGSRLG